jgi:hypothetical protein
MIAAAHRDEAGHALHKGSEPPTHGDRGWRDAPSEEEKSNRMSHLLPGCERQGEN